MIIDIYEFNKTSQIFKTAIRSKPNRGRGVRALLAKFVGCQPTYISHVLSERTLFSLEQCEAACRFFEFNIESTHFCLNLLNLERAGTKSRVRGELPPSSHRTVRTGPYTALHVNQAR